MEIIKEVIKARDKGHKEVIIGLDNEFNTVIVYPTFSLGLIKLENRSDSEIKLELQNILSTLNRY